MNKREKLIAELSMMAASGLIDRETFVMRYKEVMTTPMSLAERIFGVPKITVPEALRGVMGDDPLGHAGNSLYDIALETGADMVDE